MLTGGTLGARDVLDDETVTFFESPVSIIVAFALADGAPFGSHAWGLEVTSTEPPEIRLVIAERDAQLLADPTGVAVAVTVAEVPTLSARQLKGHVIAAEPPTDADLARSAAHRADFFAEVERVDGEPPELLARMVPPSFTMWCIAVTELFDQTPGPGAGAAMGPGG
jgi:hypothetical protein